MDMKSYADTYDFERLAAESGKSQLSAVSDEDRAATDTSPRFNYRHCCFPPPTDLARLGTDGTYEALPKRIWRHSEVSPGAMGSAR